MSFFRLFGAISCIAYPAALIASVMSIAAEGPPHGVRRFSIALPYILLCFYPLVFLGLDKWAWGLLGRGSTGGAFAASALPAVGTIALYVLLRSSAHANSDTR